MYAPHTVTLYNVINAVNPATFEDAEVAYITILRGVFFDAAKGANVRASGMESADSVDLFIPFSVTAVDGTSGEAKSYADPDAFIAAQDKSALWTLTRSGDGVESFFVKGEVVTTPTIARAVSESYAVTKVDMKDYGRTHMRHWEVGGA